MPDHVLATSLVPPWLSIGSFQCVAVSADLKSSVVTLRPATTIARTNVAVQFGLYCPMSMPEAC
jgi:hypothetical protein